MGLFGNPHERGIRTVRGPGHVRGRLPSDRVPGLVRPPSPNLDTSFTGKVLGAVINTTVVVAAVTHELGRRLRTPRAQRRAPFN